MPDLTSPSSWLVDVSLTHDARSILQRAGGYAAARGVPPEQCDALDILNALLQTRGTLAEKSLRELGLDASAAGRLSPQRDGAVMLPGKQVLLYASREAAGLGHLQVDSVHLLLALLYSDSRATSAALQASGITLYDLRRSLQASTIPTNHGTMARVEPRASASLRRRPLGSLGRAASVSPVFLGLVAFTAAAGAALWFGLVPGAAGPLTLAFVLGGWIVSLCVHEFGHAAVAYVSGDASVERQGYLSFNPLRYANPFMSVVLPVAFLLLGGIALPGGAVYIDHSAIRSRVADSLVSAAGPAGTLLCGLLIAAVFSFPGHEAWLTATNFNFFAALAFLGFIQFSAFVLNLIPVPGFDGFGILAPWLAAGVRFVAYRYATFAMIGLFLALWYVAPVRDAYFQAIFHLTALANIDPTLVFVALSQMPHL